MWPAVSLSSPQAPSDILSLLSYVIPPLVGYFVMAVLAVTPRTHVPRVALWPVITCLALRAAVSVDMSFSVPNRRFFNTIFMFAMFSVVTRTFDWTLAKEPLMRHQLPTRSTIMDALDLASTLRGYGWDWARKVHVPCETRPTDRGAFTCHVILSAAAHALICGISHISIRSFAPTGHGSLSGGSIFDDTIPFPVRFIRASILSACASAMIYAFIQACYDVLTVIAVLVLGHDPAQWPPAFDAPWFSTSLVDFWGRRWHQFFRRMFLVQGGYLLAFFFGKVGLLFGAFLSSGVLHYIAVAVLDDWQSDPWRVVGGFEMMALGILAEEAFRMWTGRKPSGVLGWLWTMIWLLLWGNLIVDGFARAGVFGGHLSVTEMVVPPAGRAEVARLVTSFDSWLRTL